MVVLAVCICSSSCCAVLGLCPSRGQPVAERPLGGFFRCPSWLSLLFSVSRGILATAHIYSQTRKEKIIQVILLILIASVTAHLFTGNCPTRHWVRVKNDSNLVPFSRCRDFDAKSKRCLIDTSACSFWIFWSNWEPVIAHADVSMLSKAFLLEEHKIILSMSWESGP